MKTKNKTLSAFLAGLIAFYPTLALAQSSPSMWVDDNGLHLNASASNVTPQTVPQINNISLYTVSGNNQSDSSGASSTLYVSASQCTFIQSDGSVKLLPVPQTVVPMSGLTASIPEDVYVKNINGVVTVTEVAWGGANTAPTRGTDLYGRYTLNGDATSLLVGGFNPHSATTTEDDASAHDVNSILMPRTKTLYAALTANASTASTTPVTEGASTANGVGRVSYFQCVGKSPVNLNYIAYASNNNTSSATVIGIGLNSTTVPSCTALQVQYGAGVGFTIDTSINAIPLAGNNYAQKLLWCTSGTGNVVQLISTYPASFLLGSYQG